LHCIADSAYKGDAEDDDCLSVRGYIIALAGTTPSSPSGPIAIIEYLSKKQSLITRSTYASELRNAIDAALDAIMISTFFHEVRHGRTDVALLRTIMEAGQFDLPLTLFVDNMSLFQSVTGTEVVCKDAAMKLHALYLRQMLDRGMVTTLTWIDTRDMLADALTKGKISRDALMDACNNGRWILNHYDITKTWQSTPTTQPRPHQ